MRARGGSTGGTHLHSGCGADVDSRDGICERPQRQLEASWQRATRRGQASHEGVPVVARGAVGLAGAALRVRLPGGAGWQATGVSSSGKGDKVLRLSVRSCACCFGTSVTWKRMPWQRGSSRLAGGPRAAPVPIALEAQGQHRAAGRQGAHVARHVRHVGVQVGGLVLRIAQRAAGASGRDTTRTVREPHKPPEGPSCSTAVPPRFGRPCVAGPAAADDARVRLRCGSALRASGAASRP